MCTLSHLFFTCASCTCTHTHTPIPTHTNDLTWCCFGSVTSMAYSWVGWFLHTLPWLSTSPRRTSRQNRIVSTSHRIWREGKGEGKREGGGQGAGGEGGRKRKERGVNGRGRRVHVHSYKSEAHFIHQSHHNLQPCNAVSLI